MDIQNELTISNQMKHWSRNLPELTNPVISFAERQENILLTIKRMEQAIKELQSDYDMYEIIIHDFVLQKWSSDEIDNAKMKIVQ